MKKKACIITWQISMIAVNIQAKILLRFREFTTCLRQTSIIGKQVKKF